MEICQSLEQVAPKKLTKRDIVNQKASNPEFIQFFQEVRLKYSLFKQNKFLRYFGKHQVQFYKTLAYRSATGEVPNDSIDFAFAAMQEEKDFSVIQFLESLKNKKYTNYKVLIDWIWIMLDGKVAAAGMERKGAKDLAEWVEDKKVTLTEIEDCFFWIPDSGRGYKLSLVSIRSALAEFDRVKTEQNGRFVGKSLNQPFKSKDEKTVDILAGRSYNSQETLNKAKAVKNYEDSLRGRK